MTLEETAYQVVETLKEQGKTISCAESCTGGMIAERITDVSGASAVFQGGVVSYAIAVKQIVLGVSGADIEKYSAVSAPVARQMAQGARLLLHSDISVSTTGVAGPGPDGRDNPQGLVYIALADGEETWCYRFQFAGDRDAVRRAATQQALALALRRLSGGDMSEGAV